MLRNKDEMRAGEAFKRNTREHVLDVIKDDGLYRHIRLHKPGTGFYHVDLITWPGHLTVTGDGSTYTFARERDMFGFFRGGARGYDSGINADYWAEKLQGGTDGRDLARSYSESKLRGYVGEVATEYGKEYPGLAKALNEEIFSDSLGDKGYALELMSRFAHYESDEDRYDYDKHPDFQFDMCDLPNFTTYDYWYLYSCHAIVDLIRRYDAHKAAERAAYERSLRGRLAAAWAVVAGLAGKLRLRKAAAA